MSLHQMIADAEAWNQWAASVKQRALERGLVTKEQLERDRRISQRHLAQLRAKVNG